MVKVVPLPTSLSKVREPWCLSTTIEREMAKPCPLPRPTSFQERFDGVIELNQQGHVVS